MFVHSVYFWLKPNTPAAAVDQLVADCHAMLSRIPTVRQMWAGKPAMTPRDVIDNSYAVGLVLVFDDSAGQDAYSVHELHQQFIARNKMHWSRVQGYDFHG